MRSPENGEVISYSYLWRHEAEGGRVEGVKNRPVAVVVVTDADRILVVPMTTTPPSRGQMAIEVPEAVRKHLGLEANRSWVIVSEWNVFTWPGFDIRPINPPDTDITYGFLPAGFYNRIRQAAIAGRMGRPIDRDT